MPPRPVPIGPFTKGLVAATDPYTQPRGTFPRGSNMLLTKRGALITCDGSQVLHAFNGALQSGRGKIMATLLFSPTGVSRYYLALIKALDLPLGVPLNLAVSTAGGGTLPAATYFYKITALDGAMGETTASAEVSVVTAANGQNTLTWNLLPNAVSYNVYRSTSTGTEILLIASGLPAPQPTSGTTVTFVDTGSGSTGAVSISSIQKQSAAGVSPASVIVTLTTTTTNFKFGDRVIVAGVTNTLFNGNYQVFAIFTSPPSLAQLFLSTTDANPVSLAQFTSSSGGTVGPATSPPLSDTTQQTSLVRMPTLIGVPANVPVSYNNGNIVALFPADVLVDGGGGGGSGGGGGTGAGGAAGGGTAAGGLAGNVSNIPQMVEFLNQIVLGLGNGFAPQIYSDPTATTVNPALTATIAASPGGATADANGVVTITTTAAHGINAQQVGAQLLIAGVGVAAYNGGPFVVLSVPSGTTLTLFNRAAAGAAASGGGTLTMTTSPIISNFVPAFPTWSATTAYSANAIIQPTPSNNHFYKAFQGGTSGATQPTFPTGTGQRVADGSVIWQEAGLTNTAAPAPPGAGHLTVYAGSLWVLNTSPTNTSNGLDGPTSLRMSDVNNANSWNPINQAFLDKDDGTEGMGLQPFTITAQGIPPQGSLTAFKNYSSFQIVGVFGSPTLTIQRIKTDVGCIAPRSLQFVPGFGVTRLGHLGVMIFNGVDDNLVSEEMRPFLFPSNDSNLADITVMDSSFQSICWGCQTAAPPMYVLAIPIGNSGGALTRLLCYDMILKAWAAPIDLPFSISTIAQFRTTAANPVTVMGGFSDGALSRWQAGDAKWDTGATGVRTPSNVSISMRSPEVYSSEAPDQKIHCRRFAVRGISTGPTSLTVAINVNGVQKTSQSYTIPANSDFIVFAGVLRDGLRFSATISASGPIEIDRLDAHVMPKAVGAALVVS